jgi:hypothetical protein
LKTDAEALANLSPNQRIIHRETLSSQADVEPFSTASELARFADVGIVRKSGSSD